MTRIIDRSMVSPAEVVILQLTVYALPATPPLT